MPPPDEFAAAPGGGPDGPAGGASPGEPPPQVAGVDFLAAGTAGSPAAGRAERFRDRFVPAPGIDYDWVEAYAKDRYEETCRTFAGLDANATSVVNYMAGGAGLFTLGTLAGVAAARVPAYVAVCGLPAVVFAVLSVTAALFARWPRRSYPMPPPDRVAAFAEHFPGDARRAKALLLPQWQWATAVLAAEAADKAWYLCWATLLMAAAVALLLLPLIVGLAVDPASGLLIPRAQS